MRNPKHIAFLIRSLNPGGAERQLVDLAVRLHKKGHRISVCVFYSNGVLEEELRRNQIEIVSFGKKRRWDVFLFIVSLVRYFQKQQPGVIYSYLTTANIVSVFLKPFLKNVRIVWGIRSSDMDLSRYDWFWSFTSFVESRLARFADRIIANSHAGKLHSIQRGFPRDKITVIPNGINIDKYRPELDSRRTIRKEWNINDHEIVIGIVARLDPKKDHRGFLKACSIMDVNQEQIKIVWIGRGEDENVRSLLNFGKELGLEDQFFQAGSRKDMPAVYNALDILCLSSAFGEGFPNAIGEAMAIGIPCVATDVGDSERIVGKMGIIVPPGKPHLLAKGLTEMIDMVKNNRIDHVRIRRAIVNRYTTDKMVSLTEITLNEIQP